MYSNCLELVDYLVIRSGSFYVMLASSGLVLCHRNQVAVLVASSYFIYREIMEKKYALALGRETRVSYDMFLVVVF